MTPLKQVKIRRSNPLFNGFRSKVGMVYFVFGLMIVQISAATAADVTPAQAASGLYQAHQAQLSAAADVTSAQAASGLYQAHQAWRNRIVPRIAIGGQSDTLAEYAAKCDAATEIHVPGFSCSDGTEVPGQGDVPATIPNSTHCDRPNVLNRQCDPGSRFQVLPGRTNDAVAVAHCRKVGLPIAGTEYNDIAVIQYNKKNGALCFYQALTNLPGDSIPSPGVVGDPVNSDGVEGPHWKDGKPHWISPQRTEAIGCTGCHDNGGFIRSEYLAQLKPPGHVLPNAQDGFDNLNTPVRYVGLDYATNKSWSITAPAAPGDNGPPCTTCHRLAVPNRMAFGIINGTAAHFANVATAQTQDSKNPHGPSSPIWMRPGQIVYKPEAEASATKFHECAVGFFNSGFVSPPPGCVIKPLGSPWETKKDLSPIYYLLGTASKKDLTPIYYRLR